MPTAAELEAALQPSAQELEIEAKHRAHAAFDAIWRYGHMTRPAAYAWLTKQMGLQQQVHIKDLNPEQCAHVVRICLRYKHGRCR